MDRGIYIIRTLVFISLLALSRGANCPNNFVGLSNGQCYFFSQAIGLTMTWDNARTYCQGYSDSTTSYDLLVFNTDFSEYTSVRVHMETKGFTNNPFFIGGYDSGVNTGVWNWVDGSSLSRSFPLWDHDTPWSTSSYNRATLYFNYEGNGSSNLVKRLRMSDYYYGSNLYFICEGNPRVATEEDLTYNPQSILDHLNEMY